MRADLPSPVLCGGAPHDGGLRDGGGCDVIHVLHRYPLLMRMDLSLCSSWFPSSTEMQKKKRINSHWKIRKYITNINNCGYLDEIDFEVPAKVLSRLKLINYFKIIANFVWLSKNVSFYSFFYIYINFKNQLINK